MIDFYKHGINTNGRTSGKMKTRCPKCSDQRKDKRDKALSINLDTGLYKCHYCGWSGCAKEPDRKPDWRYARQTQAKLNPPAAPTTGTNDDPLSDPQCELTPELTTCLQLRGISAHTARKLGVAASREYMGGEGGAREWCICFNFLEAGERVNVKYRTPDKRFKLVSGAELIPYNIDAILGERSCIIVEGEFDCLAFVEAGIDNVISVPNGASTNLDWIDRFVPSHFEDKQEVFIAVDTDRKGQLLRSEFLRRLGVERCRVVSFGPHCKDANELLMREGPEALGRALDESPMPVLTDVYTALEVGNAMRILFENGLEGGAGIGFRDFDKLCTFEPGRIAVITGLPGSGKSEFTDEMVMRLAARHDWKAAYFSPENMPLQIHLKKLTEKLTGCSFKAGFTSEMLYQASQKWLNERISFIYPKGKCTIDIILSKARALVARKGIRMLVIDPVNRIEHQIPHGTTETQYVSTLLDRLTHFAAVNGVLVILVAHPRKLYTTPGTRRDQRPTLMDINGSMNYYNKADYGIVVERDRESNVTHLHVDKVRFRHMGSPGMASFVFNIINGRYSETDYDAQAADPDARTINTRFEGGCWIENEESADDSPHLFPFNSL